MLHLIYIMYKQVPGKHRPLQQQQKHDAAAANMQPGPSTGIRMLLSLSTITAMIPPPDQQAVPTNLLGPPRTSQAQAERSQAGETSAMPPGDGCPEIGCCLFALAWQLGGGSGTLLSPILSLIGLC